MIKPIFWKDKSLYIIDQTKLPETYSEIEINDHFEMARAIKELSIRGAPAIGIGAALGLAVGLRQYQTLPKNKFYSKLDEIYDILSETRPTAVNLEWALTRMKSKALANQDKSNSQVITILIKEAQKIHQEDINSCVAIGENGAALLSKNSNILTHCNTGGLATGGLGTALGIIITAHHQNKIQKIFVDETRPLLQGARLTMWELRQEEVPAVLNIDSSAGFIMKNKNIEAVIVGADRIAKNGDVANKIGTYSLAVLADFHNIPFYVAAPTSTIDNNIESGGQIPLEHRSEQEIKYIGNQLIAPQNSEALSPAFDITPNNLISAIITEEKIIK